MKIIGVKIWTTQNKLLSKLYLNIYFLFTSHFKKLI